MEIQTIRLYYKCTQNICIYYTVWLEITKSAFLSYWVRAKVHAEFESKSLQFFTICGKCN